MKNLFTSTRFWLIVIIAVLQILVVLKVINGSQSEALVTIVQSVIAGIVAIRTVDRTGDKKVEAATIANQVV